MHRWLWMDANNASSCEGKEAARLVRSSGGGSEERIVEQCIELGLYGGYTLACLSCCLARLSRRGRTNAVVQRIVRIGMGNFFLLAAWRAFG